MASISEDVNKIFEQVRQEICENITHMMQELWLNWSHLGVDDSAKIRNITKLVQIEKDLHRDVISETRQKLQILQDQVDKLKEETEELSRCLSVDISIADMKENMMLIDYKKELEDQITGYRQQVEQRRHQINRLLEWQRDLTDKLGVTIQELNDVPLPSEEELEKLKVHLEILQAERDKRAETFLNIQVEVKDIMDKLQIKPQNKFEHVVVTSLSVDFKVTDLNMDRLAKLHQEMQEKYEHTNNRVLELRERLTKLWECLEEDQIYRENFLHAHPGCHQHTENAIKEEIRRCDQIKRQKIQVFVSNVRTKIKLMWDNVMYSPEQREEFIHYFQDIFTEDTLTLHEMYLDKITKYYEQNKHIFELVSTRKNLWLKMTELEARATEPGRYHNRGGQLLKEEKERNAIVNNLPKIETQLRGLVLEYEALNETTFTIDGKPLLDAIREDWETRKAERTNKLSARKKGLAPPSTPQLRSLALSPPGKRNRTAAGLPSEDRAFKRQLITGSANKALNTMSSNVSAMKRTAITTVKKRVSGRLATRALAENSQNVKRKLDYDVNVKKSPRVNSCILKHKRTSLGKRRSNGARRSTSKTSRSSNSTSASARDPLVDSTMLTTYTDFKDGINEKQVSRSSMANTKAAEVPNVVVTCTTIHEQNTPKQTSQKKQKPPAGTPRLGKENVHTTPLASKNNLLNTPTRQTRSAVKGGFLTPRTPFTTNGNMQRHNTASALNVETTPNNLNRSKSHTHLVRAKNLPPIL